MFFHSPYILLSIHYWHAHLLIPQSTYLFARLFYPFIHNLVYFSVTSFMYSPTYSYFVEYYHYVAHNNVLSFAAKLSHLPKRR